MLSSHDKLLKKTTAEALRDASRDYKKLYFKPNKGNAGDSLINAGFYSICASIEANFEEIGTGFDYATIEPDELLILPGGGYLVPYWNGGSELVREVTKYDFPILLLPQSIQGREDVLQLLRPKDRLYLRERYSLEYALSLNLSCQVGIDHDLAFSASPERIFNEAPKWPPNNNLKTLRKRLYCHYHKFRSAFHDELDAFRTDSESVLLGKKRKINDISSVSKFGTKNRLENLYSAKKMLELLSSYEHIKTDRLHVMIGCILAGTPVTAFDNAYYKIRGVYEYSIQPNTLHSPLVTFKQRE